MNGVLFTINFRREAFEREQARSRQRIIRLASWLAYFGVLGLVLYTYGLNYVALEHRTMQVERQIEQFTQTKSLPQMIALDPAQTGAIERFHLSPRLWRDKLVRLAELMPSSGTLTSLGLNPANSPQVADQNKLVIAGTLQGTTGEDPTRAVVQLIATLQADSAFASGYQNIRLAHSRASANTGTMEFVIECR